MDNFADWLNIVLRVFHVVAAILWIGSSLLFMWMDAEVRRAGSKRPGVEGELWMVHGGGFYNVQKIAIAPSTVPPELHWFKWEAMLTLLSGGSLLVLIFYAGAATQMVDPAIAELSPMAAVAIGLGAIIVGWFVYDLIWNSRFAIAWPHLATLASALLLCVVIYTLCHLLSGRAAFIHVGALMGVTMVLNVWVRIIPGQHKLIGEIQAGRTPDPTPAIRAKQRSVHNNYMTLPVLFTMLAGHYAGVFGHPQNWALLIGIFAVALCVNHWWNLQHKGKSDPVPLVAAIVLLMPLFPFAIYPQVVSADASGPQVAFVEVRAVIAQRCLACHATNPTHPSAAAAPRGVVFETADQIRRHADQIRLRAGTSTNMPPANATGITPEERALLRRWVAQGARTG